jgi:hypothetical protein
MAAPNIVNVTTITAKNALATLITNTSNIIVNSASSSTVDKINYISIANYTANSITANVMINRSSVIYYLAGAITVPSNSTLVVSGKDTSIYLEEGDILQANVSANLSAHITSSYEIIA